MISLSSTQKGFTIMELMIAVVLGLLIVAAATQVYVIAIRTTSTQKASAGILDANVYGLQQVERSLRMAALGLGDVSRLNSACSGILIRNGDLTQCGNVTGFDVEFDTTTNVRKNVAKVSPIGLLPNNLWTSADGGQASNTSAGNMPQLTIQYRAPAHMVDCEGNWVLGPRDVRGRSAGKVSDPAPNQPDASLIPVDGQIVIERYFVRENNGVLELRCDAGRYVPEQINADATPLPRGATESTTNPVRIVQEDLARAQIFGMGDNGALVISGIDDFRVQFGMKNPANSTITYLDIANYITNPSVATGEIVTVKMGVLAKGLVATSATDNTAAQSYTILGTQVNMNTGQPTNAIRRVYETNTMLRNSRGQS